ncbi:hypothetical protein RJ640_021867 [Escallonia rubra]|uniref:Endonuclease/exonuclease/phosphatase domain-containing protein n=1 Tax=Escallonia rubra TaxID=112253 RepID=A0AA88RBM1_9ASTE|nr:hypothetical protein RJ640_021867 [Escallonia rubra]
MTALIWNVRGAGNKRFKNNFRQLFQEFKPYIVALMETKVEFQTMNGFFENFGLSSSSIIDPQGRSGGIWVLWNPQEVTVTPIQTHRQVVHIEVKKNNSDNWFFSAVYGSPHQATRAELWENLYDFVDSFSSPWVAAGDFNDYSGQSERRSFTPFNDFQRCQTFNNNLSNCGLMDLGSRGPKLTWDNGRQGFANTKERLDRAVANSDWRIKFPEATVTNLPRAFNDYDWVHQKYFISAKFAGQATKSSPE